MGELSDVLLGALTATMASSGLWAWLLKRMDRKDTTKQLLLGLAHEQLVHTGKKYIKRGRITTEEYQNFKKYLYEPYSEFGGNGLAERIKDEVEKLPIVTGNSIGLDKDEF